MSSWYPTQSAARSVADLVTLAKTKPAGLAYSSQGNGTPSHLILTLFGRHTGLNLLHAPYKGRPASIRPQCAVLHAPQE